MAELLILDDVYDACVLLRKILTRKGHTVHTFTEEEEALKFALDNTICSGPQ
jgi:CheY-like chemotaxis protein